MNALPFGARRDLGRYAMIVGLLVLATLALYWPVHGFSFINYDDPLYVTENRQVNAGLTWEGILWTWTSLAGEGTYWHPLTWLSHMLDCELFGMNAGAHHVVSLVFHLANVALLFALLHRLTGALWRSALVAALFALHPLQVDTVAWVAERKNVLSTLLWFLTLWSYTRYVEKREERRAKSGDVTREPRNPQPVTRVPRLPSLYYGFALLCFALGLMAKPMLVTLPFVLLLLDYWPLRRFELSALNPQLSTLLRLIREKVPFFLLAAASSVITWLAHDRLQMVATTAQFPWSSRLAHVVVSYVQYLGKVIWPMHLAVYYPRPQTWPVWEVGGASLVLAAISYLVFQRLRRCPYLVVGWLWFLGTLVPVIGFVSVGTQSLADRFAYVPVIGLFVMVTWGLADCAAGWRHRQVVFLVSAVVILAGYLVAARCQVRHWKNSETLFTHALEVTTGNYLAHDNLGTALVQQGRVSEAIAHFQESLRAQPQYIKAQNNLGAALFQSGRVSEAVAHYEAALRVKPDYADALNNFGAALYQLGKVPEAIAYYEQALRVQPDFPNAQHNLGNALFRLGRMPEALEHFAQAVRLKPADPVMRLSLGKVLLQLGRGGEAIEHLEQALRFKPDDAAANNNLGVALFQSGRVREAVARYEQALRLRPEDADAHYNLGTVLFGLGRVDEAIEHLEQALRLKPEHGEARNNLGMARYQLAEGLAAQGKWEEAIAQFQRALQLKPDYARAYESLGAALSQRGRYVEAVESYGKALALDAGLVTVLNNLAWVLATCGEASVRDGARAVELAGKANLHAGGKDAGILDTLAAAYAEAGRFGDAVRTAQAALELSKQAGPTEQARRIQQRLELYVVGRPYRDRTVLAK